MSLKRCVRCGFHENDIPYVQIPPLAFVEGQDVFDFLRSGNLAFDIDITALDQDITSMQRTISDLSHRLKHLNAMASRIREERTKFLKNIVAKRSLLSPIRRLNYDVLLLIFSYASDYKFAHDNIDTSLDMKDAPWVFLRVCHWWRRIALSSPTLWSTVKLVKSTNSRPPRHALDIVRLQLQLSGNLPIKLLLYYSIPGDVIDDAIITELVSHSSRWCQMDICVYAPVLWELSSRLGNLSALKTLTLKGFREWDFRSNMIFDAPNITTLSLGNSCRLLPSVFPTSNLRQFTGGFYNGAEFRNFISAVPRLEVLGVQMIGSGGRQTQSSSIATPIPITLHHLRQLSYLSYSETCTRYLTLPALRILSVMQSTGSTRAITALYSRSHFSLDELYLCRSYITFAAAAHSFEMSGILDLTHLHLEVNNSTVHDWITALTVTVSSCLLPNLSQLTVAAHAVENSILADLDEARHLLDMVHSRLPDRAEVNLSLKTSLTKIDLLIWEPMDARSMYVDAFRAFRQRGLDANLHFAEEASHSIDESFPLWNIGPMLCLGPERLPFR